MDAYTFQQKLLSWFDQHGRKDLPWQKNITPYRIWLSEIMLQQTQVTTVIPYFLAFTEKFPTVEQLAAASLDEVLGLWSGLGYYARARNLHKSAQHIADHGYFPQTLDELMALPGIGQSTAGAIMSIAFRTSQPILDGNVKRVLSRFHAIAGWPGNSVVTKQLWAISTEFTPIERVADYTQAMMDLGATVCTRSQPHCSSCPVNEGCQALLTDTVSSFPTPKISKKLPSKTVTLLLLQNQTGQILLQKKPAFGIWGGLWSLPEFANQDTVSDWCLANHITVLKQTTLSSQRHTFSHFHLDYTPLFIQTEAAFNQIMDTEQQLWCNAQDADILGLAAPIKRLLQQHFQQRGKND